MKSKVKKFKEFDEDTFVIKGKKLKSLNKERQQNRKIKNQFNKFEYEW